MSGLPIGRRAFLTGRLVAHLAGRAEVVAPSRVDASTVPDDERAIPVVLGKAPRVASEIAAFYRRDTYRSILRATPMLARIERYACLAAHASGCTVCIEHCPVPEAIRLVDGYPYVDATRCDGCARCEAACPAPGGAVRVLPAPTRRAP